MTSPYTIFQAPKGLYVDREYLIDEKKYFPATVNGKWSLVPLDFMAQNSPVYGPFDDVEAAMAFAMLRAD
jgi:hypothetical protein